MSATTDRRIFSDTLAGYVTYHSPTEHRFGLRTSDGREFTVHLARNVVSRIVRNLGDPYQDTTSRTRDMLGTGRFLFAYGIFYEWEGGARFEAKEITFPEESRGHYVFEHPNWWVQQAAAIADFYLRGQDGYFHAMTADANDIYRCGVLEGLWVDVNWFWSDPLPSLMSVLKAWALS